MVFVWMFFSKLGVALLLLSVRVLRKEVGGKKLAANLIIIDTRSLKFANSLYVSCLWVYNSIFLDMLSNLKLY